MARKRAAIERTPDEAPAPEVVEATYEVSVPVAYMTERVAVVEVPAPAVIEPAQARLHNPELWKGVYVPLAGGPVRLGPKGSITVAVADLTDETRRAEREGRITIQHI